MCFHLLLNQIEKLLNPRFRVMPRKYFNMATASDLVVFMALVCISFTRGEGK